MPARHAAGITASESVAVDIRSWSIWPRAVSICSPSGGFIVIGAAVCSFNSVYGQGMTSAALQARALRDRLTDADSNDASRQYFRSAAKKLTPIWQATRINDFAVNPVDGWRSIPQRLLNWRLDNVNASTRPDYVAVLRPEMSG